MRREPDECDVLARESLPHQLSDVAHAGDEKLRTLVKRVYDWLLSRHFLEPPLTAIYASEEHRVRDCASTDGNSIWYSVRLGLEDERTRVLVDRLTEWRRQYAGSTSSFQESLIPARCADAIALLESKQLPDGGFPLEEPNAPTAEEVASRHSYADWGPSGRRQSNALVSLAALLALQTQCGA